MKQQDLAPIALITGVLFKGRREERLHCPKELAIFPFLKQRSLKIRWVSFKRLQKERHPWQLESSCCSSHLHPDIDRQRQIRQTLYVSYAQQTIDEKDWQMLFAQSLISQDRDFTYSYLFFFFTWILHGAVVGQVHDKLPTHSFVPDSPGWNRIT